MKLSEKALKKIQEEMEHGEYQIPCGYENVEGMSIYHLAEHDFESNDFEDCVMLTVKEAKEILQSSYDVLSWSRVGPTHRDNAVYVQNLLKYRIEQAEGYLPIHGTPMEGKLILPKQEKKKDE